MKSQRSLPKARKFFWCGLGLAAGASAYMIQRRRKAARAADWNRKLTSGEVRTALVTGASSGIGQAYARALATQGFNVMLVARRQERLEELAEKIRQKNGVVAEVLVADLSTNMGIARVEERISERGDIDFLVNNAGYDEPGSFPKIPIEKTLGLINCLMLASVRLSRAALPGMLARRCGAIVNVSSIGAFGPKPRDSTYVASKAYINLFSESLSIELAGSGIHVQALCPGFTLTEFHDAPLYAQYHVKERIPGWLWMTPEAVVEKSLKALGEDRRVCIPGLKNQLITTAARSGLSALLLGVLRSFFSQGAGMTPGGRNTWVEHWGRFASSYEEKVRYVTGTETFELLSQKLQEQGLLGDTLDLGCGTGKYTAIIAPLSRKVVAVDLSPDLLAVAQEKLAGQPNVEFQLADAEKLDFPPASFDTVLMANVLPILNAPKVLGEVARLLRPGGKLLAAHFTLNGMALPDRAGFALRSFSTFGLPPRGRKDYSPSELASLVRQASFRLEEAGLIGREVKAVWLRACKDGVAQPDPLTVLACPQCHGRLSLHGTLEMGRLACETCCKEYPVVGGIPRFIRYEELSSLNRRFAHFYDWFSYVYLPFSRIGGAFLGGEDKIRREILDRLEPGGGRVLEVSIGPGVNLPILTANPAVGEIFGLDISMGQLTRCQGFMRRDGYAASLYLGTAEALPFHDESFESVFHIGGINFFSDKKKAIQEMIRVAKPGAKIIIADETERGARGYEIGLPGFRKQFERKREPVRPPVDLVPPEMEDLRLDETVWKGWFYCIEFCKPSR